MYKPGRKRIKKSLSSHSWGHPSRGEDMRLTLAMMTLAETTMIIRVTAEHRYLISQNISTRTASFSSRLEISPISLRGRRTLLRAALVRDTEKSADVILWS